jgi:poly-beta-1,6-N-acetyl-D-glucosamine synthase
LFDTRFVGGPLAVISGNEEVALDDLISMRLLLVCCFLDEEKHLPTFLASLEAQSRPPDRLLLVDDGSSDGSGALADAFAAGHSFASVIHRPRRSATRDRLARAAELSAFQWALGHATEPFDLIGKIDADLRLTPLTFAHLEACFRADAQLGVVGPFLSEASAEGEQVRDSHPVDHVRGALKLYRRECLDQMLPLPEILGWDTIDEITARMHGWATRSVACPDGDPLHLRPTGTHDGVVRAYRRWGACAWGYGAHPLHVLLSAIRRIRSYPIVVGGASFFVGWAAAGLRAEPRARVEVRRFGRREQVRRMCRLLDSSVGAKMGSAVQSRR